MNRTLILLVSSVVLVIAGCDSRTAPLTGPDAVVRSNLHVFQVTEPITGLYTAVVTAATDLNNASFGRDPSEWLGKTLTGTFSIDLTTPGVGDRDPDPDAWALGPVPGPGPFIEFVTVTAVIDGHVFRTSSADYQSVFFGDVVTILDSNAGSAFNPQDSFVGVRGGGIGRSIVGFDASFAPGGVSFDGISITIDPALLQFGHGVIDDLLEVAGTVQRQGTIVFSVTKVSLTRLGALVEAINDLADLAVLQPDQIAGLINKVDEISSKLDAGRNAAACNQLAAFINQVGAFVISGHLTAEAGESVISVAAEVRDELGC